MNSDTSTIAHSRVSAPATTQMPHGLCRVLAGRSRSNLERTAFAGVLLRSDSTSRVDHASIVSKPSAKSNGEPTWADSPRSLPRRQKPQFGFGALSSPLNAPPVGAMITLVS
jgi:hypothetical protein